MFNTQPWSKSASISSMAGRYDNPIPSRFLLLAPIDCLKIPALRTGYNFHFSLPHRGEKRVEEKLEECICVSALSAGADTTTLLMMVDRVKEGGCALVCTPPSPGWAEFTIMMECTPESCHCHSICTFSSVVRFISGRKCVIPNCSYQSYSDLSGIFPFLVLANQVTLRYSSSRIVEFFSPMPISLH
jgi:hypothetical protein